MQTSRSDNRRACRGFRNDDAESHVRHRNRRESAKNLRTGTTSGSNEIAVIRAAGYEYNQLKKVEALLRIHAQANSSHQEIYQGLYCISIQEKRHNEAIKWGQEWVKHPSKDEQSSWKQAQLANKLKDLEALKRITKSLISLDSRKAPISLQWCIKHHLIAEEWDEATRAIKKLKKMGADTDITKAQEAMCIIESERVAQKEKINRLDQLGIENISCTNKIYDIIKKRTLYEKGAAPSRLNISKIGQSFNRHGIGVERLLVPILMNANEMEQAIGICDEILKANPSAWQLRQLHGECLLRQGQWRTGFTEQWIHYSDSTSVSRQAGEAIYCNGTLGETLFYSRWLTYLDQRKHVTTVYAQQPLLKLLKFNFKNIEFLPLKNTQYHKKNKHLPITLLPTNLQEWENDENIFAFTLRTDEGIVSQWRDLLKRDPDKKLIAINWHGSALKSINKISGSDINLESFSCLTTRKDIKLVSLQKGTGTKELENCSFKSSFHEQQDIINNENRIEQLAGIIANCDAVICDDSGPAHLASNLGKETIINATAHCSWFWQQCAKTGWKFYPTTQTSYFSNTWDETIATGFQKLQHI